MTIDQAKAQISIAINNNTIQTLLNELATVVVKNEELTAELAALKAPKPEEPK